MKEQPIKILKKKRGWDFLGLLFLFVLMNVFMLNKTLTAPETFGVNLAIMLILYISYKGLFNQIWIYEHKLVFYNPAIFWQKTKHIRFEHIGKVNIKGNEMVVWYTMNLIRKDGKVIVSGRYLSDLHADEFVQLLRNKDILVRLW